MTGVDGAPALRLSELLGVLSFGADLGMGRPMDHLLRQSTIALALAERMGLDAEQREAVHFGSLLGGHRCAADELVERLGLDRLVRGTVEQSSERWDGRGVPRGARGTEILLTAQLVGLADVVEARHRAGGFEAAVSVARQRSGTQFGPDLVDAFAGTARSLFAEVEADEPWDAMVAAEPASRHWLTHPQLDAALEAVADFVDVRSPFTVGHSRGVAALAGEAAGDYGLDAADTTLLRRAALVDDLGRLGVPDAIWDKPGPLSAAEREHAQMHAYLTERMLVASPSLGRLAAVAGQHHERLDGSGYPRGLTAADVTPAGRLLGAADSYRARLEPRPHRPAQSADQAAAELRADVHAGRIDGDAAHAVLSAAGQCTGKRREWPAGLTAREVEILRLLARGLSNKQIAARLTIAPKTANAHVEHIYSKLGVGNRALASLFAAKHGLISVDDV